MPSAVHQRIVHQTCVLTHTERQLRTATSTPCKLLANLELLFPVPSPGIPGTWAFLAEQAGLSGSGHCIRVSSVGITNTPSSSSFTFKSEKPHLQLSSHSTALHSSTIWPSPFRLLQRKHNPTPCGASSEADDDMPRW